MVKFKCPEGHDPKKAYLSLVVTRQHTDGWIFFFIEDCYLPDREIGDDEHFWVCGWRLVSVSFPEFMGSTKTFAVWGSNRGADQAALGASCSEWFDFLDRVSRFPDLVLRIDGERFERTKTLEEVFFEEQV